MTVRFLADEDVRNDIVRSLRSREPAIDLLDLKTARLRGMKDGAVLELAAQQHRIVISHDRETMTRHFRTRVAAGQPAPGLFIAPQQPNSVGAVVESLILVWNASQAEEWQNQIVYLPFN